MAAGYYDAEGVWIYGESDNIALFSDLLNLGENSVSDQFTLDRSRITTLETNVKRRFVASSSTARDANFGVPANDTARLALQNSGAECIRTDLGYTERYYATYNASTNPGGATTYGWYPASGDVPKGGLIRNAVAVSIANATYTTLTTGFDLQFANGMTVVGTTNPAITIPVTGLYRVNATIPWPAGTVPTLRQLVVTKNKTGNTAPTTAEGVVTSLLYPGGSSVQAMNSASITTKLTAGDVIRLQAYQASGAALTIADNTGVQGASGGLWIEWAGVSKL